MVSKKNIISYPYVKESCSVLFTILLPYILNTYSLAELRFLGFDGTYSKGRYFYSSHQNQDYKWSESQETEWSKDFKFEIKSFLEAYNQSFISRFQ